MIAAIMAFFTGISSKFSMLLIGGLVGLILLGGLGGYLHIRQLKQEIAEYEIETRTLRSTVETLSTTNKKQRDQIHDLSESFLSQARVYEERIRSLENDRKTFEPVAREIHDAPEKDNAPVAPVLRNTIERLRKLRGEGENSIPN